MKSQYVLIRYILSTYFFTDLIESELFREYYWLKYGVNLKLSPEVVIKGLTYIKENPGILVPFVPEKIAPRIEPTCDKIISELSEHV